MIGKLAQLTRNLVGAPALGGILTAVALGGIAGAVTDTSFIYTSYQDGYFTIDGAAVSPLDQVAAGGYTGSAPDGYTTQSNASPACVKSGVNLPQNATITELAVWYRSAATAYNPLVQFWRHRLGDGAPSLILSQVINDNSNSRRVALFSTPSSESLVNNAIYSYLLQICLDNNDRFYGARIKYKYKSAGD